MKNCNKVVTVLTLLSCSMFTHATENANDPFIAVTGYLGARYSDDFNDSRNDQQVSVNNDFSQALAVSWFYDRNAEGELLYSTSEHSVKASGSSVSGNTKMRTHYLQFGGRVWFTNNTPFATSIGLGIGASVFDAKNYGSEVFFSGNITGGMRYKLSNNWALKADLRLYGTVLNSNSTVFCNNNQCLIDLDNDVYVQAEVMGGIEYKF